MMNSNDIKPVAAIVVTYNRKALLTENIGCLLRQTYGKFLDIVIIDNASTDGTEEALREYAERGQIRYINTGANLGGAGGFNFGMRYAAENGYKYVWVMDDDCMPQPDALEELCRAANSLKGRYGFLSSKVLWTDGTPCNMNIQKKSLREKVRDFDEPVTKIITSTFVSMFIPVRVIKKVGLPIKEFFIWCDDLEYSRRISKRYPCYLINSSVAIHKCATNIGSDITSDTEDRLDRYYYAYRNEVYYFRHEGIEGLAYFCVRLLYHIFRVITKARDNKLKRLSVIFRATLDGFGFDPEPEYADFNKNGNDKNE